MGMRQVEEPGFIGYKHRNVIREFCLIRAISCNKDIKEQDHNKTYVSATCRQLCSKLTPLPPRDNHKLNVSILEMEACGREILSV